MQAELRNAIKQCGTVLLGKSDVIRLSLCCLLAKGHLLLEDLPGVGKTTLSHALANALGLQFSRVQFTSDLLPADILGFSIFDQQSGDLDFKPGPIFSQLLLADEVNRATPKTQSALLEAMSEYQVTSDGVTHPLPTPFFVVATQNPERHGGTFTLPEAQLDRFAMRLSIGYPHPKAERLMLSGKGRAASEIKAVMKDVDLLKAQAAVDMVEVSSVCMDYIQRLVEVSRNHADVSLGLSPRAALTVINCAKAWAFLDARAQVTIDDVQAVFPAVAGHRLRDSGNLVPHNDKLARLLLEQTPVLA